LTLTPALSQREREQEGEQEGWDILGQAVILLAMPRWLDKLLGRTAAQGVDPLGERGENVAARYLRDLGYKIILRNFRCDLGEIDIVARDQDTLVFVEVKTRSYDDPSPEEQVGEEKQHQLTKAGKYYLGRYGPPKPPARFDVVSIVWPQNQAPEIRHIKSAFQATF
jgi:putative endonuclease